MPKTKRGVFKLLAANRKTIRGYGVRRLGLFGSLARGQGRPASDIDLLVEFEKKTFDAYMGLKLFLEELFGCRVDLVLPSAIKPRLRETILREVAYVPGL